MKQEYTSANTSRNKIPSLFKSREFGFRRFNFDLGGGKYDTASEYLEANNGIANLVYDPYNRSEEHNNKMLEIAFSMDCMTVTCLNVLNVIKEKEVRLEVLKLAHRVSRGTTVYILIYEGDKSGIGKKTRYGWQNNTITTNYLDEIKEVFGERNYTIKKNLITIHKYED